MNTVPNILTLIRIGLIPVFVIVYYLPFASAGAVTAAIFTLAAITDWLDGYLARRLGQSSKLGAFLDPVADKLMVVVALILLVQRHPHAWLALPAAIIIGREITISALREWMAELGERARVAVSQLGKVKTTVQMTAIVLLLYGDPIIGLPIFPIGLVCLYVASLLTLWSMCLYLWSAWPKLAGS